jgi:cytochrome c oxidase subunit 2
MEKFLAQYMPPDASTHGPELDRLSAVVHWLMLILFLIWGVYFVYVLFRFRAGKNKRASYHGAQTHISTYAEAGVAVVEVILLVGFSIPIWSRWAAKPNYEKNPLEIRVVAEQFAWNIWYPGADGKFGKSRIDLISPENALGRDLDDPDGKDDVVTINDLHMEVQRPVIIHLSSKDVIHSFNLPVMRVKQDAIPGLEVPIHFTPARLRKPEEFKWEIACAQLCGLGHFRMRGMFSVDTKEQLAKWMVENGPEPPEAPAAEVTAPVNPVPEATPAQTPPSSTGEPSTTAGTATAPSTTT